MEKVKVIKLKNCDFIGKDMLEVENFDDFKWLINKSIIYLFNDTYYLISESVAWYYVLKKGEHF